MQTLYDNEISAGVNRAHIQNLYCASILLLQILFHFLVVIFMRLIPFSDCPKLLFSLL